MEKINVQMQLPVSVMREENLFVAYTSALDLSTAGKTQEEAQNRLREAIEIFFDEMIKKGTLGSFLRGNEINK